MSKALEHMQKQYEALCQQFGDLQYKKSQIDKELSNVLTKLEQLNQSLPSIQSIEQSLIKELRKDLNQESK